MKRIKITLSIVLSLIIAFAFGVDSSKAQAKEKDRDAEIEEMFKIQEAACVANELIYASFEWDETYVYPDDFAGNYIDYDTLHVQVTSEEAIEHYKTLLEGYDCVCYDVVKHSYNELYYLAESVVDSLPDKKAFAKYYVDIKENKAVVCILKEYKDKVKEFIPADDRLIVDYSQGYIVDTSSIVGGSLLTHAGDNFTLGGSGTYGSSVAFLSCGHGLSYGNQIWQASQYIGNVSVIQFANYQAGDYSIIIAQPGYTATSAVKNSGGTINYSGYLLNPTVGTVLYKYGSATNQSTCQVTQIGVSHSNGTITTLGLTETHILSGSSQVGDSGGPFRFGTQFCGIIKGHDEVTHTYVYFTPYGYPYYAGFTIKTN